MSTLFKSLITGLFISAACWLIIFTLDYMPTLSVNDQLLWAGINITATIGCLMAAVGISLIDNKG